jgi:hypothetical protein
MKRRLPNKRSQRTGADAPAAEPQQRWAGGVRQRIPIRPVLKVRELAPEES